MLQEIDTERTIHKVRHTRGRVGGLFFTVPNNLPQNTQVWPHTTIVAERILSIVTFETERQQGWILCELK